MEPKPAEESKGAPEDDMKSFKEELTKEELETLKSGKTWEDIKLDPALIKALLSMNLMWPSTIQADTMLKILQNKADTIIVNAKNGSGKTFSYLLPLLNEMIKLPEDAKKTLFKNDFTYRPLCVVVVPSVELARQVNYIVKKTAKKVTEDDPKKEVKISLITSQYYEEIETNGGQILIATPGCLVNASSRKATEAQYKLNLDKCVFFVLDEADNVLEVKKSGKSSMREQCETVMLDTLLAYHAENKSSKLKILLVSATFDQRFTTYIEKNLTEFKRKIDWVITEDHAGYVNIKHFYIKSEDSHKRNELLGEICKTVLSEQACCFFNYREEAAKMQTTLEKFGISAKYLGGDMEQADRKSVLNEFMNGKFTVLLTTNVVARGVDNRSVELVINRDIPIDENKKPDYDTYMHRCGRAGRFGDRGIVINLIDSKSEALLLDIQKHFKFTLIELKSVSDIQKELEEAHRLSEINRAQLLEGKKK